MIHFDDLYTGLWVQVSFPPPGVFAKHWVDGVVISVDARPQIARIAFAPEQPIEDSHGVAVVPRDLAYGLVRRQLSKCPCYQCKDVLS